MNEGRVVRRTRPEAARYAIASAAMDGRAVTPEMRALLDRWAAGELDDDGLMAAVLSPTAPGGGADGW